MCWRHHLGGLRLAVEKIRPPLVHGAFGDHVRLRIARLGGVPEPVGRRRSSADARSTGWSGRRGPWCATRSGALTGSVKTHYKDAAGFAGALGYHFTPTSVAKPTLSHLRLDKFSGSIRDGSNSLTGDAQRPFGRFEPLGAAPATQHLSTLRVTSAGD
jgi:hypothetical protein